MIIYMGVGIPIVQSRCYQCADKDAALLTVVDISNYGCTCGCGDVGNKNVKSGSGCSCHHDKMMERKSSDVPCSSVKIQKINLPVLGTSLGQRNTVRYSFDIQCIQYKLRSVVFCKKGELLYGYLIVSTASKRVFESYLYTFDLVR